MQTPSRYHLLDVLRGLAAFAVVVWHYQHFFYLAPGVVAPGFDRAAQPFFAALWPAYTRGAEAVELFFCLSGFVFFHVYLSPLSEARVGAREFWLARFSRLYPLHLATLLWVAAGQWLALRTLGHFFIYPANDAYHFLLNLGFVSHWGFQSGWSFNAPVWSVSVEIALYAVFFVFATTLARLPVPAVLIAAPVAIGAYALHLHAPAGLATIAYAAAVFFAGGIACLLAAEVARWQRSRQLLAVLAVAIALGLAGWAYVASGEDRRLLHLAVFPAVVLLLALLQGLWPSLGHRVSGIGEITYATYLLHVPLQLAIVLASAWTATALDFTRGPVFLAYVGSLVALSVLVARAFERPVQSWLRRRFAAPGPSPD